MVRLLALFELFSQRLWTHLSLIRPDRADWRDHVGVYLPIVGLMAVLHLRGGDFSYGSVDSPIVLDRFAGCVRFGVCRFGAVGGCSAYEGVGGFLPLRFLLAGVSCIASGHGVSCFLVL